LAQDHISSKESKPLTLTHQKLSSMQQLAVEILQLYSPVEPGVQVLLLYSVVQ